MKAAAAKSRARRPRSLQNGAAAKPCLPVPTHASSASNHHERRKPITLEEAMLEMEDGRDYVAYRDADKQVVPS